MIREDVRKLVGEVVREIAEGIETGQMGRRIRVGLTLGGSELGSDELRRGAHLAQLGHSDLEVVLLGPETNAEGEACERLVHEKMEKMLDSGEIDAAVTMHYSFPIGVSTVGRVVTPGRGREMFISTTTGTSATGRVQAMVKNAVYGIIAAKAAGIAKPTVGILNVEGARQVERALRKLSDGGYQIQFASSVRADGGAVMRGNDLLAGGPDVMVCDSLTGNVLMKVFSAFSTGGEYEASGYGYGPGIGEGYNRIIMILSRASGAPVVAGAIRYAADLVRGGLPRVAAAEFAAARQAGLDQLFQETKQAVKQEEEEVAPPPEKLVTHEIAGIDILEIEAAVRALWRTGIYASTGMGCTGPVIMVADEDLEKAKAILAENNYL